MEHSPPDYTLAKIIERLPVAIAAVDQNGVVWLWNAQAEKLLGHSADDIVGLPFSSVLYAQDIILPETGCAGIYLRSKAQGLLYVHLRILNHYTDQGDYTGAAICILNVNDGQPAQIYLHASEARYRAVVEDQHEMICRFTSQGDITFANSAFYKYFNLSRTQKINIPFWELFEATGGEKIKSFVASLNDKRRTDTIEIQTTTADVEDESRWQEWNGRLLITEFGAVEYQFIGRDSTDSRLAEQRRTELALERERARILRNFMTDVSHDLRTPTTSILLALTALEHVTSRLAHSSQVGNETIQHLIKLTRSAQDNAERLRTLLDSMFDMMDYDALEEYCFESVEVNSFVKKMASAAAPLARAKQIELECQLDPEAGLVMLDACEMSRAVQNLLDNAIKYSRADSKILLRTGFINDQTYIEVEDSGNGIAENDLPHIFERFFRTDIARRSKTGGSGLGLAICKNIVEAHGGTIEVESTLHKGSVFRIMLPARK